MVRCAHLLDDKDLLQKALTQMERSIENSKIDDFVGAGNLKCPDKDNQRPHAVYFRALIAHYSATGDKRFIDAMVRHYLSGNTSYTLGREVVNVENMLWLYEKTGNEKLYKLAVEAFNEYNGLLDEGETYDDTTLANMLSGRKMTTHGVTFNETAKIAAIVYKYTGEEKYLKASVNAYKKIDRDQMLVDGIHSSTERLKGRNPDDGHETCDIADYTWSIGHLFLIIGSVEYADKIERACFNAAPGAVGPYFKSLQYFSFPNQVIAASNSNHTGKNIRTPIVAFQPHHYPECCSGNVNRVMPNYIVRMWAKGTDGSIASVLFGSSTFTERIGSDNTKISIIQETEYPFSNTINYKFNCEKAISFLLKLEYPAGAKMRKFI